MDEQAQVTEAEVQVQKHHLGKVLLLGFNALLFLAGATFFLLMRMGMFSSPAPVPAPAEKVETAETDKAEVQAAKPAEAPPPATPSKENLLSDIGEMVRLEPLIVNLSGGRAERYLRLVMHAELLDSKGKEAVDKRMPQIRNQLIFLLSSKSYEQVSTVQGKYQLQEEILQVMNSLLGKALIKKAYFTEFVVE